MNLIRSEFFFFTNKGYLQIAGGILFYSNLWKREICHPLNHHSCEIFHAWPLSLTPFIFLPFSLVSLPSFLLSFDYISIFFNFIQTNPLCLYFPAATCLQRYLEESLISPFVFHRANETRNRLKRIGISKIERFQRICIYNKNIQTNECNYERIEKYTTRGCKNSTHYLSLK